MTKNKKQTDEVDKDQADEIFDQFDKIITGINNFKTQISSLQQNLKNLEKNVKKQMNGLKKIVTKNNNKGNRAPSGFATPRKVTNELCNFMNKSNGTEIARTEVTKALIAYIKENKLENEQNSQFIYPDEKLKFLLDIKDGDELTYFNIQKYMNKHFIKNTVDV
jgi:chromatin remodeling complex protein RSC6